MRAPLLLLFLAGTAAAQPSTRGDFDAEVVSITEAPKLICGRVMATQPITLEIKKVQSGPLKKGERITLGVITCSGGPLLRKMKDEPFFELDTKKVRPGSLIHVDGESTTQKSHWFTTTDKISVMKL